MDHAYIKENLRSLLSEIKELSGGREVTLVAVTKSGTDEELIALAEAGVTDVGENRPQELARRGALLAESGYSPRLHEIGNLQKNKVRLIAEKVALIHSLDSYELALEIDKRARGYGRKIPVLIEVNSAREEAKGGVMPEECEALAKRVSELDGILLKGLMTMGPVVEDPELIRPYFALTKRLFDDLTEKGLLGEGAILSMGMSDSYKVAIEEGSTLVRVGRRLFIKPDQN